MVNNILTSILLRSSHSIAPNNNIYFSYKDIDVLISYSGATKVIRLFWNGFDSTWDGTAFDRSKRRFEKKIK